MGFCEDISIYVDPDKLIGPRPNSGRCESGNSTLLVAVCATIASDLGLLNKEPVLDACNAVKKLEREPGCFNKKLCAPDDQITHDDVISIVVVSDLIGMPWAFDILEYSLTHAYLGKTVGTKILLWLLNFLGIGVISNTGSLYFTAIVKPWHQAFYKLVAKDPRFKPHLFEEILFIGFSLAEALMFFKKDFSSLQLVWLQLKTLSRSYNRYRKLLKLWEYLNNKLGRGVKTMLEKYHSQNPVFAKYVVEK